MKKFLLFLSTLFLFACGTQEKAEVVTKATLSGTITAPKGEKVKLSKGSDKFEAPVTDGKFTLEIELSEAGHYNFGHGGESTKLFIEPGDNIAMVLNTAEFDESLSYTGTGAEENNFQAASYLLNETEMGETADLFKKDEADFIAKVADIKTKKEAQFAQFQKDNPTMNTVFIADQKIHLLYDWASMRNRYESYHRHYAKDKEFNVSESYNDFKKKLDVDNPALLTSSTYKNYINDHFSSLASDIYENDAALKDNSSTGWLTAQMKAFNQNAKEPAIKNFLTFGALKDQISFVGTVGVETMLEDFKKTSKNEEQKTELQELLDKWSVLAKGEIAPNFEYADIKGKMVALKDFRGKNVYIDVWATWCGPCLRELPHLEKLQEKYHGNENIVFASVSIDDDKAAWEKMVEKKEMMGVQLIGDEAWSSSICKDYLIRGIPRFILVDKAGKIINAKAPRPSSDDIKDILKEMANPTLTSMK